MNVADIYLFKVNNRNRISKIYSKLTIKTLKYVVLYCKFEQISPIVLVFPLLTLRKYMPAPNIDFKKVHACSKGLSETCTFLKTMKSGKEGNLDPDCFVTLGLRTNGLK